VEVPAICIFLGRPHSGPRPCEQDARDAEALQKRKVRVMEITYEGRLGDLLESARNVLETARDMYSTLYADTHRFAKSADPADRRAAVRAVFAFIEGTCFSIRRASIGLANLFRVDLSEGELQMAREVSYAATIGR
jgi:hypothetical protein